MSNSCAYICTHFNRTRQKPSSSQFVSRHEQRVPLLGAGKWQNGCACARLFKHLHPRTKKSTSCDLTAAVKSLRHDPAPSPAYNEHQEIVRPALQVEVYPDVFVTWLRPCCQRSTTQNGHCPSPHWRLPPLRLMPSPNH